MWHKLMYVVALIALGLLAVPPVTQAQTNIAPNPSMEEDEVFQDDPSWTAWCTWNDAAGAGSTAKFDDTEFVDGARSIRIDAKGGTDWYFIVANISMPAKIGTKYTASFWAKAEAPRSIGVQWKAADNSVSWGFTNFDITTEWAEYYFTVPAQSADIKIEFFCAAVTTPFWIDFLWVYEGDYVAGILPSSGGAGSGKAVAPKPTNGAVVETLVADLSWKGAKTAVSHQLYFGTDAAAVGAGTGDALALAQTTLETSVIPGYAALVPGQVYYWRVDEVNDANPESPWQGDVWSFRVRPKTAWKPYPPDGMRNVGLEQDLSWDVGMVAMFHMVFVGDNADAVAGMTAATWQTTEAIYEPGPLQADKTYYWRVDEFTTLGVNKGPVWSFRTVAPGGGVQAEYFAGKELAGNPILTQVEESLDHNWSNEVAGGLSDNVSARWTANLEVPFAETYTLITSSDDGVRLWFDGRLVIDNWTDHGTTDNKVSLNLLPGQYYSIRMEWYEAEGGAVAQLSWESATLPRQIIPRGWLQLPLRAAGPHPVNGDPGALQTSVLSWIGGAGATEHVVYFGQAAAAVAEGAAPVARQKADETRYDPGPLEWGKTYYWRVDEVNAASAENPLKGAVWTFTAADFVIVEDVESYTAEEGSRVFDTWLDGWVDHSSGSIVGFIDEPYVEQRLVHSGYQSMPFDYNNVNEPFYSEIERDWETAQDWTENGVNTLTLFVFGRQNNSAEAFYVTLTDKNNKSATVVHSDAKIVQTTKWTRWDIPLSSFTNVNPATVKKLVVGVGNRSAPVKGGAGRLLLDDIRVTKQ